MTQIHELKTLEIFYRDVVNGHKNFEVRKADRNFKLGDSLKLVEVHQATGTLTGRSFLTPPIKYILYGSKQCSWLGVKPDYCVLGF